MKKLVISILLGIIFGGIISKYIFVASYLNLFLWGGIGIGIGFWSDSKKLAIRNSGVYGFVLSFVFMFVGYQGSVSIISRIPFFAILGLVGLVCGSILGFIGSIISQYANRIPA